MSAITAKASRKMKKYAVLTREPRCFLGSFDFSWEQRKLEDYLTVSAEKNTGNIYGRSDVLSVSGDYGIVNQIEFQGRSFAGASVSNYGVVQTGDVVYTKSPLNSNPYGIIKTNKGKPGIVSTLYAVYHPKENAFSDFIQVYFEQHARMNNYMHPLVNKGAKNDMKVSAENALKGPVCFPSRIEQESISAFFSVLDNLITLHQRKCANLCSPSQVVFSLLFATSTFSWEQRKVGDLLIERNQQAPMSDEYPLMAFIANEGVAPKGERYDRSALVTDTVNKLYKKTEKGDFIYSSNNLETGSIGLNKYGKACISPVYSIFEPTGIADSDFLGRRLVRKDFINAMVKWRQGVIYGQWRIHESDFLKIEITVPSVEEQRKIGTYLDKLDHLITLHQRKPFLMKWRTSDANRNQTNRLVL